MSKSNNLVLSRFLPVLIICIFLVIAACFLAVSYADRIVAFSIENLTDYKLTYDRWGKGPFNKAEIDGFCFESDDGTFAVYAEKMRFNFEASQLIKHFQFVLGCDLAGVSFSGIDKTGTDGSSLEDIMAIPFDPEQKYDQVKFTVVLGKDIIKVMHFDADSRNIRMKGHGTLLRDRNDISVDFTISFSPEMSNTFSDDVKRNVLSLDEDGWYSTVITFRGNALLFKAIYSIAIPM